MPLRRADMVQLVFETERLRVCVTAVEDTEDLLNVRQTKGQSDPFLLSLRRYGKQG